MKRRSLLTWLPAVSAMMAMRSYGAPIPAKALTPAGFGISVQCWSLREFTTFEAIEMASAAGMGGVEFFPGQRLGGSHGDLTMGPELSDEVIQSILGHLSKHGLVAYQYGVTDIPKDEAGARKIFGFLKKLGAYGVSTESLESIDVLEKLAQEYDLKVCFHNHPKPTPLWNPDTVWKAIEGRHRNLGYCADVGHWASSGLNPLEVIKKIGSRVHAFHMKDRASIEQWSHDRPFGTGVIDIAGMLDEVRRHGFAGNVTIEYEHHWKTNLPEIAQCVGYLRAYSRLR